VKLPPLVASNCSRHFGVWAMSRFGISAPMSVYTQVNGEHHEVRAADRLLRRCLPRSIDDWSVRHYLMHDLPQQAIPLLVLFILCGSAAYIFRGTTQTTSIA